MTTDATQGLVQQATRGDAVALEALIVRNLPALLGYIRLRADSVIRHHEACCDVAQSVCREALEELDEFEYRGEPAFRKWLFTLALRKLMNKKRHYQAQRRDVRKEQPLLEVDGHVGLERLYASLCSPSEGAIAHETAARLEAAFDQLPEDYRTVITLSRLIGMSHQEIAAEMGRSEGAVRTLLNRALVRLGKLMADAEAEAQSGSQSE